LNCIHATAIVADGATIGEGVRIGPFCTVGAEVVLGARARLISHVVLDGRTRIGEDAVLYPFCTVGMAPQDLKYRGEPTECEVGAGTQLREHVTIHRGTLTGSGVTRVGSDCLLMAVVHVAHDCTLGDGVVVANNVVMGGHVSIGDHAIIGGAAAIHQNVRIGRGAMIGGVSGVEADVIPWGSVVGNRARLVSLNLRWFKRRGYDRQQLLPLQAAFKLMFRDEGVFEDRVREAREVFGDDPIVAEVINFIDQRGKRGLIHASVREDPRDA